MKIAYILNTYPQPTHSFIRRELVSLEQLGFEVERIAMRRPPKDVVLSNDQEEQAKTHYVLSLGPIRLFLSLLMSLSRPAAFFRAFSAALAMGRRSRAGYLRHLIYFVEATYVLRRVHRVGAQHIHAHFGTNATAVAMLVRLLGGPSYSFTVHGPEEFDTPHALSLKEKVENSAFAVTVSQFGRSQLCRWVPFDHWSRIKVVHCGIDPEKFKDTKPAPEAPLSLIAIGRLAEQKGLPVLVNALARLREDLPEMQIQIVGDGPLRGLLQSAVDGAGLGGQVDLKGWMSESEVQEALNASHALVLPSFAEGLPMVVMEAMAAGRPVIATYVAGIPELVLDGETGWLVPAGDDAALADAIRNFSTRLPEARNRIGRAARARVLERHNMHTEASKLAAHIKSTVRHMP